MIDNVVVIICLYLDDMLIFNNNSFYIKDTNNFLSLHFDMKDMGCC
jgi:hypothetical protein